MMDIRTENPYWLMKSGFLQPYSSLKEDITVDFAVIGGGISGALQTYHLAEAGARVAMVDRRHIGFGSTCASTALLQYDIDYTLVELTDRFGEDKAVRAYKLSLEALEYLEKLARKLPVDNDITRTTSVYFAEYEKDLPLLQRECDAREKHGFQVEMWDAAEVGKRFPFPSPGALYTKPAATVDPYRLTHGLLQAAMNNGAQIYDKTAIDGIERNADGVVLHTGQGHTISAKKIVIACGYEAVEYLPYKLVQLTSTYAFASEPLPNKEIWFENCIFWDTGNPYLYGRTTKDNRIIFGGKDEMFYSPARRDELVPKKIGELTATFEHLFPEIPLRVDYSWAGTFIETEDGLPYIGTIPEVPHTIFALGYGGNGITFSQIAAWMVTEELTGRKHPDAEIFGFERRQQ